MNMHRARRRAREIQERIKTEAEKRGACATIQRDESGVDLWIEAPKGFIVAGYDVHEALIWGHDFKQDGRRINWRVAWDAYQKIEFATCETPDCEWCNDD